MDTAIISAAAGTGFLFLMTALGAAAVFFFRHGMHPVFAKLFPGFAAGVMLAASVWSLLDPAIAAAETMGMIPWLPAAGGILAGVLLLMFSDAAVHGIMKTGETGKTGTDVNGKDLSRNRRGFLLQLAMVLHNIPEGMAVGLSFALAAETLQDAGITGGMGGTGEFTGLFAVPDGQTAFSAAAALALGIGIQNIPEGAAVALPLRQEGMSAERAFLRGSLSGIVEPIAGILTVFAMETAEPLLPWVLSFAAGAMLYVVAEELIPEANGGGDSYMGTVGIMSGFLVTMILDVALG